jgi:hypothetical protein
MRGSVVSALLWLAIVPAPAFGATRSVEPSPDALYLRAKRGIDPSGRTGYLKKRFVGGPFQVIPEAVLEQDLGSDAPWALERRTFVVLGPEGYSWSFRYDRASGVPTYRHHVGQGSGSEILEVDAPESMAFAPVKDILIGQGLICTNRGTCKVPGCNCCIVCYCGLDGVACDTDDTGFYSRFERLEGAHEVVLR